MTPKFQPGDRIVLRSTPNAEIAPVYLDEEFTVSEYKGLASELLNQTLLDLKKRGTPPPIVDLYSMEIRTLIEVLGDQPVYFCDGHDQMVFWESHMRLAPEPQTAST